MTDTAGTKDRFQATLTRGPIGTQLFRMAVPMIWGMLAMMVFNITDSYFVAKLGTIPLAAMGFIFPVIITIAHVALGVGIGASSVISRAIGVGDHERVMRLTTDSILLSLVIVGFTLVIGFFTIKPLFTIMGASAETLAYIEPYMKIWYAGSLFLVVPMVGNHAIRASGDTFSPGMIMVTGSALNIILDPLFIFGYGVLPAMGIRGAALATITSRAVVCGISLWLLSVRKKMITCQGCRIQDIFRSWCRILHVGIPSIFTMMLPTIAIGILTWMVSAFGQKAVAGFGVAHKIEGLSLTLFMALSTVFGPFVGQNWGAGQINRVRKGFTKTINFSVAYGLLQAACLFGLAPGIVRVFDDDPAVMRVAVMYLRIIPVSYGIVSIVYLASSAFNALGKPSYPIKLMLVRLAVLHIPCAYLGRELFGLIGFLAATHVATFVPALLAVYWARRVFIEQQRRVSAPAALR
jgi:putative MATE family efflux protein